MTTKLVIFFLIAFTFCKYAFSQDTTKYYYGSGQLKLLQVKFDSANFYEKMFYEDGELMTEGYMEFIDGRYRKLNFKAYYKGGAIKVVSCDTSYTMYEPAGKVYYHYQTKDGVKNGNSFNYFNGLLFIQGHYKNGEKDGKQISYFFGSGKLSSEENYLNGKLDGLVTRYDTLGNISLTISYKNGSVIRASYFDSAGKVINTTNGEEEDKNRRQVESLSKDATK